ncbi:hypothetical protein H9639_05045 [Arthrobacter sp. Sa2CUA1]|uniref:Uncharacterized protein n=1 Tax=Arthrobacter gallicola TaxID=2762225 RepID=A0ABR8UQ51_9MICC|nr:hypothetical protein [Arthrobacter gallicola]MBD7994659.1 hypothetical protein [Arthrobacter gallicola]
MASLDYEYGYRLSTFSISGTQPGGSFLPLDHPALGENGALGVYFDNLTRLVLSPGGKDRKGRYLSVESVRRHGICLLVNLRGGPSGDESDIVVAGTNEVRGRITKDDALTWDSRILLVFPQGNYLQGFMVAEAKGRSNHGPALQDRLEQLLKENESLRPEVTHDVVDALAWKRFFQTQDARTHELEFTFANPAGDGTNFTEDHSVRKVRLVYTLEADGSADHKSTKVITGQKQDRKHALLAAVGGHKYASEDVEEAVATVVANGKARKYRVSNSPTRFTHIIESIGQLDEPAFLREAGRTVFETSTAMKINLPNDWLPLPQED